MFRNQLALFYEGSGMLPGTLAQQCWLTAAADRTRTLVECAGVDFYQSSGPWNRTIVTKR